MTRGGLRATGNEAGRSRRRRRRRCLSSLIRADLATERKRHLTTGKRAERTKLDFRCPICRSAIGELKTAV